MTLLAPCALRACTQIQNGTEESNEDEGLDLLLSACNGDIRTLKEVLYKLPLANLTTLFATQPEEDLALSLTVASCRHLGAFFSQTSAYLRGENAPVETIANALRGTEDEPIFPINFEDHILKHTATGSAGCTSIAIHPWNGESSCAGSS